jgi:hypothetical protein
MLDKPRVLTLAESMIDSVAVVFWAKIFSRVNLFVGIGAFSGKACRREEASGRLRPSSRALGGIRFSVRKRDNAKNTRAFLFQPRQNPSEPRGTL